MVCGGSRMGKEQKRRMAKPRYKKAIIGTPELFFPFSWIWMKYDHTLNSSHFTITGCLTAATTMQ